MTLNDLAVAMPKAYAAFGKAFDAKIRPVQSAIHEIRVRFMSKTTLHTTDGPVSLGVSRVGDAWGLTVHATGYQPLPIDSAPVDVKLVALKGLDAFVDEYVAHVGTVRGTLLTEYAADNVSTCHERESGR